MLTSYIILWLSSCVLAMIGSVSLRASTQRWYKMIDLAKKRFSSKESIPYLITVMSWCMCTTIQDVFVCFCFDGGCPVSILRKSISGRHRPVRVADGPMTARWRPDVDLRRMLAGMMVRACWTCNRWENGHTFFCFCTVIHFFHLSSSIAFFPLSTSSSVLFSLSFFPFI